MRSKRPTDGGGDENVERNAAGRVIRQLGGAYAGSKFCVTVRGKSPQRGFWKPQFLLDFFVFFLTPPCHLEPLDPLQLDEHDQVDRPPTSMVATESDRSGKLRIFVTVGTTRFDSLVRAVLSHAFFDAVAQLAPRSPAANLTARAQVVVQYGNSSIADILTTSALASIDEGSEIVPEPGMRIVNGRRVYQSGSNVAGLDPGQTGTISGLRLRNVAAGSSNVDARNASKSLFESIVDEAKAMQGLTTGITSALQGATLQAETQQSVQLELFQFAPDLTSYIQSADIVISHAGSGTILDTLRMRPKPPALVVVPNTSLMDNHQVELAQALGKDKFLIVASEETLARDLARALKDDCEAFPDFDPTRFGAIVDEVMQF